MDARGRRRRGDRARRRGAGHGPAPAPFQPADHTVDQVNEHLADAGAEERERVIQAEAEGKARRGIIQGPYADLSGQE